MKINFDERRGNEIQSRLESFISDILTKNQRLQDKLNNFNLDEEIQKMKSELDDIKRRSVHEMSALEASREREFRAKHYKSCESNASIILTGTGIGTSVVMKCHKCGKKENITDMDTW